MSNITFEVAIDTLPANEPGAADWTDLTSKLTTPLTCGNGEAQIELEDDARTHDPTIDGAVQGLVRHARLTETVNGTTYPLFRGLVDVWRPRWQHGKVTTYVQLVDGLAWCALQDEDVDLDKQTSDERIGALLDLADWPAALRDIGPGQVILQTVEQNGANLLRQLEDATDAEDGELWAAPDGKITFRGRHARLNLIAAATLGTDEGLPLVDGIEPEHDTFRLTNIVRVELASGDTFIVQDPTAIGQHGRRTDAVRDVALSGQEANGLATWDVYRFKDAHTWLSDIKVDISNDDDLETVLQLDRGDLVDVVADVRGQETTVPGVIETIEHAIGVGSRIVTFDVSPYFGEGPWFTWNDPAKGWNSGARWAP